MTRLAVVTDLNRCVSCLNCMVACKEANDVPIGNFWIKILRVGPNPKTEGATYPDVEMYYLPVSCQHCENPACVKVCPVGATYKDPETGVVRQDYDKCIGCRMCMSACPYTGVRSFNWEEPQYVLDFPMGDAEVPKHQKHTVEKCTMCWHRLAKGLQPACIEACTAKVRYFGDFDDPDSEVSRLIATREYKQLLVEEGTRPSVYYLV